MRFAFAHSSWIRRLTALPILLIGLAGAAVALGAEPGTQPIKPGTLIESSQVFDTFLGLIAVLALMLGLAWLVKRYVSVPGMGRGQVRIVGGVSLGPRERAVLVEVEGHRLLLGVAPGRVQTLHVLGMPGTEEETFAGQLAQIEGGDKPDPETQA